ncbi:HTH domain-containing protein [Cytobacillus kochii]
MSEEDIKNFLADGNSVSVETKYKLAVPVLFLHYICK